MPLTRRPAFSARAKKLALLPLVSLVALIPALAVPGVANATATPITFAAPINVDATHDFNSVSCPNQTFCMATDNAGNVLTTANPVGGAAAWQSYGLANGGQPIVGNVSCASASLCLVTDQAGFVVTTDPTDGVAATWRQFGIGGGLLTHFSCAGVSFCMAVGGQGDVAVSTNPTSPSASWTLYQIDNGLPLQSVSCPTPTQCAVVDNAENIWTTNQPTGGPGTWASINVEPPSDSNGQLLAIDCTSATLCVATDAVGNFVTSTDAFAQTRNWLKAGIATGAVNGVSCPSVSFCVALNGGQVWESTNPAGGPGAWALVTGVATDPLSAISCPSVTLCVTVDGSGNAVVGTGANYAPPRNGYWLVGSDGGIFSFGAAAFHGSTGSLALQRPVVGISPTADENGYWLVASDGGIFAFGDAPFVGSIPGLGLAPAGTVGLHHLNAPIVGMVPSADGGGYFMVASDGGVFAFGDAQFEGSCPAIGGCAGTAVAVVPDASGAGYWVMTATGHVYAFGDARYYGAPGPEFVPVTAAAATPDGGGYWILFSNGVVGAYGDAASLGGPIGELGGTNPASALFTTAEGGGYWVAGGAGGVFTSGNAPYDGSMAGVRLNGPIIAGTGF
jgi:hypothetical protein